MVVAIFFDYIIFCIIGQPKPVSSVMAETETQWPALSKTESITETTWVKVKVKNQIV